MRIKKIAPVTPANGNIENAYGTSQTNTYSQEYQNEHNIVVSSTQPTTSERVWFKQGKNLFNKATILSGYGFNSDGTLVASPLQFVDNDYIQVQPNTKYILSCVNSSNNRVVICEYNSSKTFIQRDLELNNNKNAITTTANTYYVRCSGMLADLNDMQLELGDTRTTYEPYVTPSINVDGEEIYSKDYITDQSNMIVTIPYTSFTIATNHFVNTLWLKYNKATGFCLLSFRIKSKDDDPQYNTYNAWQNQFTLPTKYAPPSLIFNTVYNGSGSVGVVRIQPSSDSTNKGKVDVYGHASYILTEGNICWYTNAGIE